MSTTLENISDLERRINGFVPAATVEERYSLKLSEIARKTRMEGFRIGKAPVSLVEQMHGSRIKSEIMEKLLSESIANTLKEHQIAPAGVPVVESIKFEIGQPLEYVATFEIFPKIILPDFATLTIEKTVAAIEESDIEKTIQNIQQQFKDWKEVERSAQIEDRVIIDFEGKIDNQTFDGGSAKDVALVLGSGRFIPGFEDALVGLKAAEEKDVILNFPDNYHEKNLAGKPVIFNVTVKKVMEGELPTLNDEFAKKMGISDGNVETLKEQVKKHMQTQLDQFVQSNIKQKLFNLLAEKCSFALPKTLVDEEAKRIHDASHHHDEHDHNHSEDEQTQWRKTAEKNVTITLLISEIIKEHKLQADQQKMMKIISEIASVYEDPQTFASWIMEDKSRLRHYESLALEEQVVDLILDKAQIMTNSVPYQDVFQANQ